MIACGIAGERMSGTPWRFSYACCSTTKQHSRQGTHVVYHAICTAVLVRHQDSDWAYPGAQVDGAFDDLVGVLAAVLRVVVEFLSRRKLMRL